MGSRVLLTGATGFVGRHVYPALVEAGHEVVCASRRPAAAARRFPGRSWVRFDVDAPETYAAAFDGCDAVLYLVHGMGDTHGDYVERERAAARAVAERLTVHGVERVVYLGGVEPHGAASRHLQSRLDTGALLRAGRTPAFELRAGVIVGAGSESWCIIRDLSVRLPVMVLPGWMSATSRPVAIDDVVAALCHSVTADLDEAGCYGLPGPEVLTGTQIILRTAGLRGHRPFTVPVPFVTPRLSSYWITLITRAEPHIARELIEGMTGPLVGKQPPYWELMADHHLLSFDEAARRALANDALPGTTRLLERLVGVIYPRTRP